MDRIGSSLWDTSKAGIAEMMSKQCVIVLNAFVILVIVDSVLCRWTRWLFILAWSPVHEQHSVAITSTITLPVV